MYSVSIHGPDVAVGFVKYVVLALTAACERMAAFPTRARAFRKTRDFCVSATLTVEGSTTVTDFITLRADFRAAPVAARSSEYLTSAAVIGVPSLNFAPARRVNV